MARLEKSICANQLEEVLRLTTQLEAQERSMWLESLDPINTLHMVMHQHGLSKRDLEQYLGRSNRVYEVLNRKRGLSNNMIKRLHRGLGIPAELLIGGQVNLLALSEKPIATADGTSPVPDKQNEKTSNPNN